MSYQHLQNFQRMRFRWVGEVAGHGVSAAMLMATARGILRSRCREPGTLAGLLDHLNKLPPKFHTIGVKKGRKTT